MKKIEATDMYGDLVVGLALSLLGGYLLLYKKNVVKALLSSNEVFWDTLGLRISNEPGMTITNIMIPIIGFIFFITGLMLLGRFFVGK